MALQSFGQGLVGGVSHALTMVLETPVSRASEDLTTTLFGAERDFVTRGLVALNALRGQLALTAHSDDRRIQNINPLLERLTLGSFADLHDWVTTTADNNRRRFFRQNVVEFSMRDLPPRVARIFGAAHNPSTTAELQFGIAGLLNLLFSHHGLPGQWVAIATEVSHLRIANQGFSMRHISSIVFKSSTKS